MAEIVVTGPTRIWLGDQEITDMVRAIDFEPAPWQAEVLANTPTIGALFGGRTFSVRTVASRHAAELFDAFFTRLRANRRRRLSRMHSAYRRRHRG